MQVQLLPTGLMLHDTLFDGVTVSPAREFVASVAKHLGANRIVLPCVGRFAAACAIIQAGTPADRLWCSDISLFTSILGYLLDPERQLADLNVVTNGITAELIGEPANECELAAGMLLALRYHAQPITNAYVVSVAKEIRYNASLYRQHIAGQLKALIKIANGIHYAVADVRAEIMALRHDPEQAFCYVNPPGYGGGYTRMYERAHEAMEWSLDGISEFRPKEVPLLFEAVTDAASCTLLYRRDPTAIPPGWVALYGAHMGKKGRVDYIFANRPIPQKYLRQITDPGQPRRYDIYADQEITPDTTVTMLQVDEVTALHYRDLFVHKLTGSVQAERYYLLLLDNRVLTAFGLHFRDIHLRRTHYVYEVFGITRTSRRYARLGKLFMLLLTSKDAFAWLRRTQHQLEVFDVRGIQTTSPTRYHEGKTDRGVMKLVLREEQKDGTFRLVYRADWRDETWGEVLVRWLQKWGRIRRG